MEGFTTSDSSDGELSASGKIDLSHLSLDISSLQHNIETRVGQDRKAAENVETLLLCHNRINTIPPAVCDFSNLKVLDISYNNITKIPCSVAKLSLTSFICKNASLENSALPKSFGMSIKELNLSGNNLTEFPLQVLDMNSLKYLYLGANKIESIPKDIPRASKLNILSLGSNRLSEVPETLGRLCWLQVLVLSDNHLESLPPAIANLKNLKSLLLHRNRLRTLPPEIIALKCLTELSLRDNPLVVRFVSDMTHHPASLMELAARVVKQHNVNYNPQELPCSLHEYLQSAHHCVNPKCKGVFFDNRIEHIKFVDFCGKYRIPLLQYLCSSKCVAGFNASRRSADRPNYYMMKKVLLG